MESLLSLDKLVFLLAQAALAYVALGTFGRSQRMMEEWAGDLAAFQEQLRTRAEPWPDVVKEICAEKPNSIVTERYRKLTVAFRLGAVPYDQGALNDELFERAEESYLPLRRTAQIAVLVGLLGTLLGLTVGVSRIPDLKTADQQSLTPLLKEMGGVLSGFGGAFVSAVAGVLVAIVATWLVGRLEGQTAKIVREFRDCAQDVLLEAAAHRAEAKSLPLTLESLSKTLAASEKGLPKALDSANDAVTSAAKSIGALQAATKKMTDASADFAKDMGSTGGLKDSLARLQSILDAFGKENRDAVGRIEGTIETTMQTIVRMQQAQIDLAESLNRMVVERPMEVASSRLLVGDRDEFRRMSALVESINRESRSMSAALVEVRAESERNAPLTRRIADWIRSLLGRG